MSTATEVDSFNLLLAHMQEVDMQKTSRNGSRLLRFLHAAEMILVLGIFLAVAVGGVLTVLPLVP